MEVEGTSGCGDKLVIDWTNAPLSPVGHFSMEPFMTLQQASSALYSSGKNNNILKMNEDKGDLRTW